MTEKNDADAKKMEEAESCPPPDPSMISPEMRKVYLYVSNTLFEQGRRSSPGEVAQNTGLPVAAVEEILDAFEMRIWHFTAVRLKLEQNQLVGVSD